MILYHHGRCLCPNLSLMSLLAKGNFLFNLLFTPTLEIQVTIIQFLYQHLALFHKVPLASLSLLRLLCRHLLMGGAWQRKGVCYSPVVADSPPFPTHLLSCLPGHNTIKRNRLMVAMAFGLLHYPGAAEMMSVTHSYRRNSVTA